MRKLHSLYKQFVVYLLHHMIKNHDIYWKKFAEKIIMAIYLRYDIMKQDS